MPPDSGGRSPRVAPWIVALPSPNQTQLCWKLVVSLPCSFGCRHHDLHGEISASGMKGSRKTNPSIRGRQDSRWCQLVVTAGDGVKEITQYRRLENAPARTSFIARFWAARDPDLSTAWNETEEIFWQRVADADSQFRGAFEPGWKSDRGGISITLAPFGRDRRGCSRRPDGSGLRGLQRPMKRGSICRKRVKAELGRTASRIFLEAPRTRR